MSLPPPIAEATPPPSTAPQDPPNTSYGQILRSSFLIGGSTAMGIGIRIARGKAVALLLGPAGVGVTGIFTTVADLLQSTIGLGINSSGVRQIADSIGTGDAAAAVRTVAAVRRVALILATIGAVVTMAFCWPLAHLSFGDDEHAVGLALLSVAVFAGIVGTAQVALLQATRRVFDLARARVFGALSGLLVGVPIIYVFGMEGIAPSIVAAGVTTTAVSWWFTRTLHLPRGTLQPGDLRREARDLIKLGLVFMITDPLSVAVMYITRIVLVQELGTESAGFYHAAWVLAGVYVGFILDAMGADFFPRLTPRVNDRAECSRLVNEQVEVGLLMAGPGVLLTLTFAPLVVRLCYSAEFAPAVDVLRWLSVGMLLRVASWPLGYVLRASGRGTPVLVTEVAKLVAQIALVWVGVHQFGLNGAGIGFVGSYVFYLVLVYGVVRRRHGFRWSPRNFRMGLLYSAAAIVAFAAWHTLSPFAAAAASGVVTLLVGLHALQRLWEFNDTGWIPPIARRVVNALRPRLNPC